MAATNLTAHRASLNATLIKLLVTQRLGNLRDTGKYGARAAVLASLRANMAESLPELLAGVFVEPRGADALSAPDAARVDALAALYVESEEFLVAGAPAHLALFRRRLNQARMCGA